MCKFQGLSLTSLKRIYIYICLRGNEGAQVGEFIYLKLVHHIIDEENYLNRLLCLDFESNGDANMWLDASHHLSFVNVNAIIL